MPVVISLLRGVNVGGHNKIKMDVLRALYESIGLREAQTFIQSGNVVFRTKERDLVPVGKRIEDAIEKAVGFRPALILRTVDEVRSVVAKNPFVKQAASDPNKLLVSFLGDEPGMEAREKVSRMKFDPELLHVEARELYIFYPNGMGQSKLSIPGIEKVLRTRGTGRNWNSVLKLVEIAESLK